MWLLGGDHLQLTVKDVLEVPELPCPLIRAGGKLGWLCQRQRNCADTDLARTKEVLLPLKVSKMTGARICMCGNQGGFQFVTHISTE